MRGRRSSLTKRRNDIPSSLAKSRFVTSVSQEAHAAKDDKMHPLGLSLFQTAEFGLQCWSVHVQGAQENGGSQVAGLFADE